jgi:hypothetical protein
MRFSYIEEKEKQHPFENSFSSGLDFEPDHHLEQSWFLCH